MTNLKTPITIGMPVYNGAEFIVAALDSLLAQTFTDFELIISDNASTDATQSICEEYVLRDARIRYVRQPVNQGALTNFQFVLDQAKGKFFMWAAADDQWDPHWIMAIYSRIKDERNTAGFGGLLHIGADSESIPHPANHAKLDFSGSQVLRKLKFYLAYEGKGKANLFYALYPRKILQRIELSEYEFDYQILFSLLGQVSFVQVGEVCLYKRIHGRCEGVAVGTVWRHPFALAPLRILKSQFQISSHYLHFASLTERFILILLMPIKFLIYIGFQVMRGISLIFSRIGK